MSNRFIYFFLSTTILVSIYIFMTPNLLSPSNITEFVLNCSLYIYDYLLLGIYILTKKNLGFPKKRIAYAIGYFILASYSYIETYVTLNDSDINIPLIYFGIHIGVRTLFLSVFCCIEPFKSAFKNINNYIIILAFALLFIGNQYFIIDQIEFKLGVLFEFILYMIEALLIIYAINIKSLKSDTKIIFIVAALFIFLSDFLISQNIIFDYDMFAIDYNRVINTLGELGVVYSFLELLRKNKSLVKK
jgi:hypothetical protein